jgi:phosphatidylethanolamine-binding protein (PEBP) family uncharacterized protein
MARIALELNFDVRHRACLPLVQSLMESLIGRDESRNTSTEKPFSLSSPHAVDGANMDEAQVFNSFGCRGRDVSPALSWTSTPTGTKSFPLHAQSR